MVEFRATIAAKNVRTARAIRESAAFATIKNPVDLAEDNALATISQGTADTLVKKIRVGPNGGTSGNTGFTVAPELFRMVGGLPVIATELPGQANASGVSTGGFNISAMQLRSAKSITGGLPIAGVNSYANALRFSTMFDGQNIEFSMMGRNPQPLRFLVNDQYVSKTALTYGGNNIRRFKLALPSRARRKIEVETQSIVGLCGVNMDAGDTIWAPSKRPRIAVCGDSLVLGANATYQNDGWTGIMGRYLGCDVSQLADGGTGYLTDDAATGFKMLDRISDFSNETYDLAILSGGYNDYLQYNSGNPLVTPATIQAQVQACILALRTLLPTIPIVVFGCYPGRTGPNANLLAVEAAIQTAVTAVSDPNSLFVPMAGGSIPWVYGTGYTGTTNGTGNSDYYVDGSDQTHLNNAGHAYKGARAAQTILDVVVPWLAAA